jgi:hypothetical protein
VVAAAIVAAVILGVFGEVALARPAGRGRATVGSGVRDSSLPLVPPRADIVAAMRRIALDVAGCASGQTGFVTVRVGITGATGKAWTARVESGLRGRAAVRCVERTMFYARFPRFRRSSFVVVYPFRL